MNEYTFSDFLFGAHHVLGSAIDIGHPTVSNTVVPPLFAILLHMVSVTAVSCGLGADDPPSDLS